MPDTERGADGLPQTIIPGAEKISDGKLAQRRMDQPLRPKAAQKPPGGLFDDGHKQVDLVDLLTRRNGA